MTERHEEIARRVVGRFKRSLGPGALREITEDEFTELESLIHEALADELQNATEQMGDLVRRMRSEVERPPLGM